MHPITTNTSPQTLFDNNPGKSLRSRALDLLRFPLAVVIVISHTIGFPGLMAYLNNNIDYSAMTAVQWMDRTVACFFTGYSVPIYFLIAGYVFFLNINLTPEVYAKKMKNRFRSLFIPYMAWNALALIILLIFTYMAIRRGFNPQLPDFSFSAILETFWNRAYGVFPDHSIIEANPQDLPLWFVKVLMLTAATSPVWGWLNRHTRGWWLLVLGGTWLLVEHEFDPNLWQWITGVFFFSAGGWLSMNGKDMIEVFRKFRLPSFILFPVICTICLLIKNEWPDIYYFMKRCNVIIAAIFAYNAAAILITRFNVVSNRFLTSSAFFIYAGHYLVHSSIVVLLGKVWVPVDGTGAVVFLTAVMLLTLALLLATYWLMRRYTPRLLGIFTGGRL